LFGRIDPDLPEEVLREVEGADEGQGDQTGQQTEHSVGEEFLAAVKGVLRNRKGREVAQEVMADHRGRDRGDDDRGELGPPRNRPG
jgi:hypothetical protein